MRRLALGTLLSLTLVLAVPASAGWDTSGSGAGAAAAKTMTGGNVPSGTVAGSNVTVSWSASSFAEGGAVPSYVVKRYNALSGAVQTIGAGCAGLVSGTSCTENGVPIGTWKYSVTPAAGAWRGAESAQSANVVVLI